LQCKFEFQFGYCCCSKAGANDKLVASISYNGSTVVDKRRKLSTGLLETLMVGTISHFFLIEGFNNWNLTPGYSKRYIAA
jgi:hypothetical protein